MMLKVWLITLLAALMSFSVYPNMEIKYSTDGRSMLFHQQYYESMLQAALDYSTSKYGDYKLIPVRVSIEQSKMDELINKRQVIDVYWTMTSPEREKNFNVVRVPLFAGLGGCRLFLIDKSRKEEFQKVNRIDLLTRFTAGQGYNWPDSTILESNNIPVVKVQEHESLHKMLVEKRFDYFPRALFEIFTEATNNTSLTIVETIGFKYDAPFFFFVKKNNPELAERLEYGLNRLKLEGRYFDLLNSNQMLKEASTFFKENKLKIVHLTNPHLTKETRLSLESHSDLNLCN